VLALDHVYVFCRPGAPERQPLLDAGLRIGRTRRHVGQGTENVCFFFAESMLELIWLADEREARQPPADKLQLARRAAWRTAGTSPFGISLRRVDGTATLPFTTTPYAAPYLPPGVAMDIAHADAAEPMLFVLPAMATWNPPDVPHALRDCRPHWRITAPHLAAGSPLRELRIPGLEIVDGDTHRLELVCRAAPTHTLDLAPELPLVLRW
jgi:hypothetical protein